MGNQICNTENLRDHFAGLAMKSLLDKALLTRVVGVNNFEYTISKEAYQIADAMMKERGCGQDQ